MQTNTWVPLFPEAASTFAWHVDALYFYLIAISVFFTIPIVAAIFFFIIKFRERGKYLNGAEIHGSMALETAWSVLPFIISMTIFLGGAYVYYLQYRVPDDAMEIFVVGKQWMWKIQHGTGQREINELHVPVGRRIKLTMTTEDVLHDFSIPAFRTKADVVPGRYTYMWFEATKPGKYHLFCAEYCGLNHSGMGGYVYVMEQRDFDNWLAGTVADQTPVEQGRDLFENKLGCASCHAGGPQQRGAKLEGIYGKEVKLVGGQTAVTPFCPSQTIGSVCTIPNFLQYAQTVFPSGNIRSTISPYILNNVLAGMPTTSNFTGGDGLNTLGYRLNRRQDQDRDQYSSRIDVDVNDRNSLSFIYNYNKEVNLRPDIDATGFTEVPDGIQSSANKQFTMAYRRVFTSNFITEFRGGIFTSEVPFDRISEYPAFIASVPLISGPNTFTDQGRNTKGFNYQANSDWIVGKHTFRFGGQLQFFKVNAYNDVGTVPTLTFASGTGTTFTAANFTNIGGISTTQLATANGLLGLLGGHFTQIARSFNITTIDEGFVPGATEYRPFRYENHGFYFSDRWSAARGLTISLGARYEIFPALRNLTGRGLEPFIADLDNPLASLLDPNGKYVVLGESIGKKNQYYLTDYNNIAPNIGVAWSPAAEKGILGFIFGNRRSVFRGGYSHVFGNDSIVTSINNASVGNSGLARTTVTLSGLVGRVDTDPVPTVPVPSVPTIPFSYLVNNGPGIGNHFGTVFGIDPKLQTPLVKQYSFGWQREIFGNMAFEIRYVGTSSNNLARGVDYGQIDVVNNGFLADFLRAQNNLRLTGNAFCTDPGCVPLQIFANSGAPQAGRLLVGGANGINAATFNNNLTNGTPLDLALAFINSTNPRNINNQPCIGSIGTFVCNPNAVPYVNFLPNNSSGVIDIFENAGWYQYDSLQTEIRRRFANGLYFQANYTFSKNITDTVGTTQQLFEPFLDNNNRKLDRQRADFDTTHVFTANGIYQLPFGRGKKFLNYDNWASRIFLSNWELSGLMQWQSGAPITFVDTRGTLNRTARSARQTANSNLSYDEIRALMGIFQQNVGGQDVIYWINPAIINSQGAASGGYSLTGATFPGQVFFNTNPGQTGNLGRTIVNGPRYFNIDMALLKSIQFRERMRVQLRLEAFNVLNNVNFIQNTQFANINSTTFGQITSAFAPRQIQWAARFEW
ncbi:cytochrome c oxidase subunit II [Leptolyngbya sp. 7M]|uniref:cytochrome c oxidase subunit II n=1 Tax=Leptolyngbya sp. 7M TaxID=2812896 RepID=UPI001B8D39FF|nr:cytochrome c oxidase subunit II [Leptolyngbya sp. 7M]QYO65754.1 cytochrome c oxidase subunit II [Leptolyngbya sp. 7M]